MKMALKRIAVVLSLASYLLASTAIHALHDHSGSQHSAAGHSGSGHSAAGHCCHAERTCDLGASRQIHNGDACDESAGHDHSLPTNCEDSCFACRFVAAKSILAAIVLPVERFETLCQIEPPQPTFTPLTQVECSLCRGPPSAC